MSSTQSDQQYVLNWRNRLGDKIHKHNEQGSQWLEENAEGLASVHLHRLLDEDEWTGDSPVVPEPKAQKNHPTNPEQRPIDLPSSRGSDFCQQNLELGAIEGAICIAQADEHLYLIRRNLVDRANLYRTTVRYTSRNERLGVSAGTRAHKLVSKLGKTVRLHAQQYRVCRAMWKPLGVDQELCRKYRDLTREDLYTNTKTYDAMDPGSYRQKLPWFWLINVKKNINDDEYIASCKLVSDVC